MKNIASHHALNLRQRERCTLVLPLFAVAVLIRFWRLGVPPLLGDEAYYYLWSERLAAAYFDHPAGLALMVRLSTVLAGTSEFGIRWLNALLGAGSVLLVCEVGSKLFGQRAGLVAAVIVAVGAPWVLTSRFVYTDALQLFLMLVVLRLIVPLVLDRTRAIRNRDAVALGLTLSLLFNTKYSALPYAGALGIVTVWERPGILRSPQAWLTAALAVCGLLPVLLWNATHDWCSLRWQYHHFTDAPMSAAGPWVRAKSAVDYLSLPVVLLAFLSVLNVPNRRHRVLLGPAAALLFPLVWSATNSPRNLVNGVTLLILSSGGVLTVGLPARRSKLAVCAGAVGLVAAAVWGFGTLSATLAPTRLPHARIADELRRQAAGWKEVRYVVPVAERGIEPVGVEPDPPFPRSRGSGGTASTPSEAFRNRNYVRVLRSGTLYAIDYQVAALLSYYLDRPAYTSWPQYRIWGVPNLHAVQIVALPFLDAGRITQKLHNLYAGVDGPYEVRVGAGGEAQDLRVWHVRNARAENEEIVAALDFLDLFRNERREQEARVP